MYLDRSYVIIGYRNVFTIEQCTSTFNQRNMMLAVKSSKPLRTKITDVSTMMTTTTHTTWFVTVTLER
jgi:hypothetical protein